LAIIIIQTAQNAIVTLQELDLKIALMGLVNVTTENVDVRTMSKAQIVTAVRKTHMTWILAILKVVLIVSVPIDLQRVELQLLYGTR
jgi:hypothetical protein